MTTVTASNSGVLSLDDVSSAGDLFVFLLDGVVPQPPSQPIGLVASGDQSGCALVSWQANPETNITNYILYYGTASVAQGLATEYSDSLSLGDVTRHELCELADGTWFFAIRAVNALGLRSVYSEEVSAEVITVVTQPPVPPLQLVVTETSPGCVTGNWLANSEPDLAGYRFYYGAASVSGGQAAAYDDSLDTTDPTSGAICDFAAGTYYFAVKAYNQSGMFSGYSTEQSVVVTGPDTSPPVVSIISPAADELGIGTVTVMVSASDNRGVAGVKLQVDGLDEGVEDSSEPYEISWATGSSTDGSHLITAVARDAAGNTTISQPVRVYLDNDADPGHPRLFLTGARMDDLRARACFNSSGQPIGGCQTDPAWTRFESLISGYLAGGSYPQMEAWHFALVYKITKNTAYAGRAIELAEAQIAGGLANVRANEFEEAYRYIRNISLVYDWLNIFLEPAQKDSFRDYLNQIMTELWDPSSNPYQTWSGRSVEDPGSYRYYRFLLATAYAGLAIGGDNPSPPQLNFGGSAYTDLINFVQARLDQQAGPEWLDTNGKGAGWHEGDHFGLLATAALAEALNIMKIGGETDYYSLLSYPAEAVHYQLYSLQPGYTIKHPGGDAPAAAAMNISDADRYLMLHLAEGLAGRVESQYAGFWLLNVWPEMQAEWMYPWDFVISRPDLPTRDFRTLPASYQAEGLGWTHSRSGWAVDAVSLSFVSGDRLQAHQHFDQNSFVIYRGDWQAADANLPSESGVVQATDAHNTILVNGIGQRDGAGTGQIIKYEATAEMTYSVGDASDAYYVGAKDAGGQPLLSIFQREVVHIKPGHVIVFDRVTPASPTSTVTYLLHTLNQPVQAGAQIMATNGSGRLFQQTVLPENPSLTIQRELGGDNGLDSWRTEVSPPAPSANQVMLNYLYVTAATTDTMPTALAVATRTDNMVGVRIVGTDQDYVVMFSPDPTGAPPTESIIYDVGLNSDSQHILLGLLPDMDYSVVSRTVGDRRVVEVRPGTGYRSSAGGRLEFKLNPQPDPPALVQSGNHPGKAHPGDLSGAPRL